jgi:acetyl-CoA carboxylase biotin carboxyl carrier protein
MDIIEMKELMLHMRLQGITLLEFEQDGVILKLERPASPVEPGDSSSAVLRQGDAGKQAAAGIELTSAEQGVVDVHSPVVGVYFSAPSPDAAPFVRVGDPVEAGQTLCIVEAMKLMNEVASPCSGVLVEVLTENGGNVEYGQLLFRILPAETV